MSEANSVSDTATQQFKYPTVLILLASFLITLLGACTTIAPSPRDDRVSFHNPPAVGDWLKPQRDLVACDTLAAAQFMSNFGFLHPQCQQLENIEEREFKVIKRERMQLPEGQIWLLNVEQTAENALFYVPIPWHDWL